MTSIYYSTVLCTQNFMSYYAQAYAQALEKELTYISRGAENAYL